MWSAAPWTAPAWKATRTIARATRAVRSTASRGASNLINLMASVAQNVHDSSSARLFSGVAGVLLFAGLTAAGAAIRIPLPGTAVPLTLQSLPVLLAGVALGSWRGSCSQLVYVLAGLAGLPVWAGGASGIEHLTAAPTAGY